MYGIGIAKGMILTFKHLFRPPITRQYPEERDPIPIRGRSTLVWYEERCTGCNTCAEACPDGCITVETAPGIGPAGNRTVLQYEIDVRHCLYCGLCTEACPFDAIRVGQTYADVTYDLDAMIRDKAALNAWRRVIVGEALETGTVPSERKVAI